MGRPTQNGLTFFRLDVDIFRDPDIRRLRKRFGAYGPLYYTYILCRAYQTGYYLSYTRQFREDAAEDVGCSELTVRLMTQHIVTEGLLTAISLEGGTICLTSRRIQLQYQEAMRTRGKYRPVPVDSALWILKKNETEGFISVRSFFENNRESGEKSVQELENTDAEPASFFEKPVFSEKTGVLSEKTAIVVVDKNKNNKTTTSSSSTLPEKSKPEPVPPTLDEVLDAARERGISETVARRFYYYYHDLGWRENQGEGKSIVGRWRWKLGCWNDSPQRPAWTRKKPAEPPPEQGRDSFARTDQEKLAAMRRLNRRLKGTQGNKSANGSTGTGGNGPAV